MDQKEEHHSIYVELESQLHQLCDLMSEMDTTQLADDLRKQINLTHKECINLEAPLRDYLKPNEKP